MTGTALGVLAPDAGSAVLAPAAGVAGSSVARGAT
jgi:hypothetical protein